MCGICGIRLYRNENAFDRAIAILDAQKDRGTASTGMAYFQNGSLKISKDTVAPDNFKGKHLKVGNIVIGHNRMPSVGAVNMQNSHPFLACDGSFALLHNGSEHTGILRDLLIGLGHKLEGDTDSEVICHAIEEFAKKSSLKDAILKVAEDCRYSTLLILTKEGEIFGIGDNAYIIKDDDGIYIASEEESFMALFNGKKKTVYHAEDKGLFRITKDGKLQFLGKFEKKKKKIEPEKEDDDGLYLGGKWWNRKEKDDDEDEGDIEADLDKKEAEIMAKNGEFCDCAESEIDFGSGICNKCRKFIEDEWFLTKESEIL